MSNVTKAQQLIQQINSVLVGKEEKVTLAITTLIAGGHLLLEDVPGVGKTTLANAIAKSINCSFGRIQFTPDTLPSDITGLSIYNMKEGAFEFQRGAVMNNIVLADEINRTAPKTQASLLEAMEEKQVTVDGIIYSLETPFMVIATQNPIDFMGTYNLPEAQLDRFLMKISLGYPSAENERLMAKKFLKSERVERLQPIMNKEDIILIQEEVAKIKVHDDVITFIVEVMEATRKADNLTLGASPRATLALIRAAQATAYLKERTYVIPDDVIGVIYPVLCHRFVQSMESKMNKVTSEQILKSILIKVTIPILRDFS
jgi:MoxR-like ATPase